MPGCSSAPHRLQASAYASAQPMPKYLKGLSPGTSPATLQAAASKCVLPALPVRWNAPQTAATMHTSKKEVRAQNAHRDLRLACPRATDSQIPRDLHPAFRRSMDEKLPAKTSPEPTSRVLLKWIHPATVRAQCQRLNLQTHQEPRSPEWTNAAIPHQSARLWAQSRYSQGKLARPALPSSGSCPRRW